MKMTLLVAAGAALFSPLAIAADLPVKSPGFGGAAMTYNWTGLYVGANVGYAWGHSDTSSTISCPTGGCPVVNPINIQNIGIMSTGPISARGFTGGVQGGYNWQSGSAVFGVETDFNAFDLKGSRSGTAASVTSLSVFSSTTSVNTDWLFTFRGRLGWSVAPTVLLYATGGLAVTEVHLANSYFNTPPGPAFPTIGPSSGASSQAQTRLGWALGAGIEWAVGGNWSLKTEYLYADFGSVTTTANVTSGVGNPDIFSTSASLKAHIARFGANYRF